MNKTLLKAIPHVVAVLVFVSLSCWYFAPYFSGYELVQSDINHFIGMSKEVQDFKLLNDDQALWTDSQFGGMPAYQISVEHKGNLVRWVDWLIKLGLPRPVGILFMAMLGFYILCLCLRINPWLGILGGVAFGLSSINILYLEAGHVSKVNAIAYMAPVLGGLLLTMRGKYLFGGLLTALFLALHLSANHLQMTYYLVFLLLFAGIAQGIQLLVEGKAQQLLRSAAVLACAAVLAFLPAASNIMTTYEYSKHSTRGASELTINPDGTDKIAGAEEGLDPDYILEYSMGRGEVFSLLIPDVKGGQYERISKDDLPDDVSQFGKDALPQIGVRYFGDQSFSGGAFYFGVIMIMLFIMGIVLSKGYLRWGLVLLTIIAVVLSWREPTGLTMFFLESVPGFAKFRDTKMMLVVVQVIVPLMAVLGLQRLFFSGEEKKALLKPSLIAAGGFTLVMLLFMASPTTFFEFSAQDQEAGFSQILTQSGIQGAQLENAVYELVDDLEKTRIHIFKADATRAFVLSLVAALLIFIYVKNVVRPEVIIGVFVLLVIGDMVTVDLRYLNNDKLTKSDIDKSGIRGKKVGDYASYEKSYDKFFPFTPGVADKQVFDREKLRFDDLADDQETLFKAYLERFDETPRNKDLIEEIAGFGALNLRTDYRVLSIIRRGGGINPTQDAETPYLHKSIGGYHGAKLRRYQDVLSWYVMGEMQKFVSNFNSLGPYEAFKQTQMLNMLNTRYIVADETRPVLFNSEANGAAWFVKEVQSAKNADEEITLLGNIDTKEVAIVDEQFAHLLPQTVSRDSSAYISLESYSPNRLSYSVASNVDQVAVFSEIYYADGWQAYLDDQPVEHFRTNYILRGLTVPKGEHSIEFVFDPPSYKTGMWLSLIGSLALLLSFSVVMFMEFRKLEL
jgi:hypothetical protein